MRNVTSIYPLLLHTATGIKCLQDDGSFCTSMIHNICYIRKKLLDTGGILTLKGCYDYIGPEHFCSREYPDDKVACCFEDNCNVDPSFEPVLDCCNEATSTTPTSPPPGPSSDWKGSGGDGQSSEGMLAVYIISPVLGPVFISIFAALAICVASRCRQKPSSSKSKGVGISVQPISEFTHHANFAYMSSYVGCGLPLMMQRAFLRAIRRGNPVSGGHFGRPVFIGEYQNQKIAIRTFAGCHEELWSRELQIYNMAVLCHDNILALFASDVISDSGVTELWLATQYHAHGPLDRYITRKTLTPAIMIRMALSIARGVAYLHTGVKPSVAHRNITSGSILVKESLECCIGDFSRSSILRTQDTVLQTKILVDRERFEMFVNADVYALGLVLWEICSRSQVGDSK